MHDNNQPSHRGRWLHRPLLVIGGNRRDFNTSSSQSAMHRGVPVRVFFRRSPEQHDSSSSTSWSNDSHVFSNSRTLVVPGKFPRVLYNNIHHHVAFARESEEKEKNTEQDQPAVRSAVAAAPPAAAAEAAAAEVVRFCMTCRFVDGQGKRGNVHIPASMSVAFPDVVVFGGFI